MRDIIVTLVALGLLPFILKRPYIGVLGWAWISYMNPHRLSWGFARDFPFALLIAGATLVGILMMKDKFRIPWTRETITLLLFVALMVVTTLLSLQPELSMLQLEKVLKIQVMTFVSLALLQHKDRLNQFVWVIVISLGLYGVKGGIFTLMTGGGYHVMGPYGTFIGGNNEIGLALIMTLPLMRYLQLQGKKPWMRHAWSFAMLLTVVAILGTQSRGALLGLGMMSLFLIVKSRQRLVILLMIALMIPVTYKIMPSEWFDRMGSIQNYEEDRSAMGRINAWGFAFNLAKDRPLTGGGFESFNWQNFKLYAPDPDRLHDAHSIYFEVLGEHGFTGLALFLLLGFFAWRSGTWTIRRAKSRPQLYWLRDLASMLQVTLVGYATAGAFLGLAYFDFFYHVVVMLVLCRLLLTRELEREAEAERSGAGQAGPGSEAVSSVRSAAPG